MRFKSCVTVALRKEKKKRDKTKRKKEKKTTQNDTFHHRRGGVLSCSFILFIFSWAVFCYKCDGLWNEVGWRQYILHTLGGVTTESAVMMGIDVHRNGTATDEQRALQSG